MDVLFISPQTLEYGIAPNGNVMVKLGYDSSAAPWLAPDLKLALEMTPTECRQVAAALIRTATLAEGPGPQSTERH